MKTSTIIYIVLILTTLLFLLYAFIQKGVADEAKIEALAQRELSDRNAMLAQKATSEARKQMLVADSLIKELNELKSRCDCH